MEPILLLVIVLMALYITLTAPAVLSCVLVVVLGYIGWTTTIKSNMSTRRKLMMATWSAPSEGTIYGVLENHAEAFVEFLEKYSKVKGVKVTPTVAILKALGVAFREAPSLNCYILGGKFVNHKTIDISCLVAVDEGKDLAFVKVSEIDKKSLVDIAAELQAKSDKLRKHKDKDFEQTKSTLKSLPVFLVKPITQVASFLSGALGLNLPMLGVRPYPFGTAMVTSVGMLGVEQAFVPFTPFARVPCLLMIGAIAKKPIVENDQVVVRKMLPLTATLDHRFVDGTEAAKLAKKLKYVIENPLELLEESEKPAFATKEESKL